MNLDVSLVAAQPSRSGYRELSTLRRKRWPPIGPYRRAGAETSLVGTASPEVADTLQNDFERVREQEIQDRTPPRNADSRIRPSRFEQAEPRRLLQQYRPKKDICPRRL